MNYYIGIDGGGTKTAFALADKTGRILSRCETKGISYRQYLLDEIIHRLRVGIETCLDDQNLSIDNIIAMCLGYPCYGESEVKDKEIADAIYQKFPSINIKIVNDVEVGWAGALDCQPGIHVVSGTGSIAFGKDTLGRTSRCGGWFDFFSDEGSCYWLGRKTMQLFSMQADGREPKGELYQIIRREFNLNSDFEFIDLMVRNYIPFRSKVALMQLYLAQAAQAGDKAAIHLYKKAVGELVILVDSLRKQLDLRPGYFVSYSGSLFKEKELVRDVFIRSVSIIGGNVIPPHASPVEGAIKLAMINA